MNRSERLAFEHTKFTHKLGNRQANVAIAEGFIHTSKGKGYFEHGVWQKPTKKKG